MSEAAFTSYIRPQLCRCGKYLRFKQKNRLVGKERRLDVKSLASKVGILFKKLLLNAAL